VPYILDAMKPAGEEVASRPTPPPRQRRPPRPRRVAAAGAMSAPADKARTRRCCRPSARRKANYDHATGAAVRRRQGADRQWPVPKPGPSCRHGDTTAGADGKIRDGGEEGHAGWQRRPPETRPAEAKAAAQRRSAPRPAHSTAKAPRGCSRPASGGLGRASATGTARRVAAKSADRTTRSRNGQRRWRRAAKRRGGQARAGGLDSSGADQYDVFVSRPVGGELNERLAAKGLAAEPAGQWRRHQAEPAVARRGCASKDLAVEGLKVQVRRAGGPRPRRA